MYNLHSRHGPLRHGFAVRQLGASTRTIKSKKNHSRFVFEIPKQSDTVDIYFRTLIQALLLCRHQSPDLMSVVGRFAQIKGIVGHKTRNKHHSAKLEPSRLQSCPHWKASRRAHSLIRRTNELLFNCVPPSHLPTTRTPTVVSCWPLTTHHSCDLDLCDGNPDYTLTLPRPIILRLDMGTLVEKQR